ncbi:cytochrome P450 [Halorientalis halophila]|uniref:cytochrome P450 n=1 Tax=Halorientalis halophila TaxID=3108499 RepID=UPI00300A20D1
MAESDAGGLEGPDGWPVVGNTFQFARDPFSFYERCADMGDVVPYEIAGRTFYLVSHPEAIERVLSTEHGTFEKGSFQREQLSGILGEGLLTSEGERWREQRQRIQPTFGPEKIDSYVGIMTDCATDAAERWRGEQRIAVDDEMRRITVQILARSLFGTDISDHVETIAEAMGDIGAQAEAPAAAALLPEWVPTPWDRRARRGVEAIDGVIEDLIDRRRGDAEGRDDLLSTLLVAHEEGEIRRGTLRDQLVTFLLAGHETTSLALSYTWYLLAENPDTRERLHAEVDDVLGGAVPTMADLGDLKYTERVVTEAMRYYPPVHRVVREASEDVELQGRSIEAGSILTMPQWIVHRDRRWYDDPLRFRPERWAGDSDRPDYAYFPFGGGPRRCIGMRFAKLEAQLILATLARAHRLELAGEGGPLELQSGVTASPAEPVEMIPRAR